MPEGMKSLKILHLTGHAMFLCVPICSYDFLCHTRSRLFLSNMFQCTTSEATPWKSRVATLHPGANSDNIEFNEKSWQKDGSACMLDHACASSNGTMSCGWSLQMASTSASPFKAPHLPPACGTTLTVIDTLQLPFLPKAVRLRCWTSVSRQQCRPCRCQNSKHARLEWWYLLIVIAHVILYDM